MCPWTATKTKEMLKSNQAITGEQVKKGLTSNAKLGVALIEESKCLGLLKETIWEKGCLRHPVAGL